MRKNLLFMLFTIVFLTMATTMRASNDEEEETTLIVSVGDVEFKESNSDVFGDGTVSYDADTHTLILNNFNSPMTCIGVNYTTAPEYFNDNPFNIELKGENTAWFLNFPNASLHVYGDGSLRTTIEAHREGFNIDNSNVLIENCTLNLTGAYTFCGENSKVTMRNVDFTGQPTGASSCFNISELILEGCYIENPEGYYFDPKARTVVGENGTKVFGFPVHIARLTCPEIQIGEKIFVASNDDVFGDGTVSYDADTRTLTFNNFNGPEDFIYVTYYSEPKDVNDNPFNIQIVGDNNVCFFETQNSNMHIYGNGSIKTNIGYARDAFTVNNTRLLVEDCTMNFTGIVAFNGEGTVSDITMRNVDFNYECISMSCFYEITDLKLEGCYLEQPAEYHFDKDKGRLVNKDGEAYRLGTVHIARGTTDISNICNDDIQMTPAYNISGQRVSSNYKGIVIENGKKKLNK